jgi:hypothetical protein
MIACSLSLAFALAAPTAVTVRPAPTDALLANPHMGWETFHRPADQDRTLPAWIPSTVYYLRWGWREVEPQPDTLNTALIDATLAAAHHAGQHLAFRVMCCSSEPGAPYQPAWLTQVGGKVRVTRYGGPDLEVPDLDDPVTLDRQISLIRRLGARYDGHPDLDHVDMGSVGWWGEWHMSGGGPVKMPTPETCRRIVDAYLGAFHQTPLLMLIGGGAQLSYACSQGAGWRADCLGDLGGFSKTWCHMCQGYPTYFRAAHLDEAWKHAPIAYETCWEMRKWVAEKWSLRYIFNYALDTHASYLNNKSAPLPDTPEVRPELERFLRRLGYRLSLLQLTHPATVAAGATVTFTSEWQNTGSAPCYRPYAVAWRLKAGDKTAVLTTKTAVKDWLPGEVPLFTKEFLDAPPDLPDGPVNTVTDTLTLPRDLAAGDYQLATAIVDPASGAPVLRLANEGRGADGWYAVSRVTVTGG